MKHWKWEEEQLGKQENKQDNEEQDIPHAEVKQILEYNSVHGLKQENSHEKKHDGYKIAKKEETDVLSCDQCEYSCTKKDTLQKHKKAKHSGKGLDMELKQKLFCDVCDYTCTKRDTLRMHKHRSHNEVKDMNSEEKYMCDQCDYSCTKKDTLRSHKNVKHQGKLSSCDQCDYSCTKNEVLLMHKFRKHGYPEPPKKFCDQCGFSCYTSRGLKYHNNAEHSEVSELQGESLQCNQCDFQSTKKDTLRRHKQRKHDVNIHNILNQNNKCHDCEYACTSKRVLDMHMYNNHGGPAPQKKLCDMCSFTCFWGQTLRKHKNKLHLGIVQSYKCDQCEVSFRTKGSLRRHQELQHGREATSLCDLCDFRTSYTPNLKLHIKQQHSEIMFHCDKCEFKSKSSGSLANHMKIHDESKWFQCTFCEYRTPSKGNVKAHTEAKHMGVRHPCPECDFVGYMKTDLTRHTKIVHLGTSPTYKCDFCDYSNAIKARLEKHHIGKHTNIKFACPHCPYKTSWVADLWKHSRGQVFCKFNQKNRCKNYFFRARVEDPVGLCQKIVLKFAWWFQREGSS